MTEITLKIPEAKVSFFMELIQSLGYEYNISEDEISNEHKELVRNRIKTANKEEYVSWTEARKKLTVK